MMRIVIRETLFLLGLAFMLGGLGRIAWQLAPESSAVTIAVMLISPFAAWLLTFAYQHTFSLVAAWRPEFRSAAIPEANLPSGG